MAKIIIVGDSNSGKSSILETIINDKFDYRYNSPTIGVEFGSTFVNVEKKRIKACIWDTAGQESYRSLINGYYKGCAAAIIVFDVTNSKSFINIDFWRNEISKNHPKKNIVHILVANKIDKPHRVINQNVIEKYCNDHNIEYFEVSAKTRHNTKQLLEHTVKKILDNKFNVATESVNLIDGTTNRHKLTWCTCMS